MTFSISSSTTERCDKQLLDRGNSRKGDLSAGGMVSLVDGIYYGKESTVMSRCDFSFRGDDKASYGTAE